jgi:site-specific DNA-methyltransferase (adenine-specific)
VFLFAKGPRYFFDSAAIAEPVTGNAHGGKEPNQHKRQAIGLASNKTTLGVKKQDGFNDRYDFYNPTPTRNARTVWSIPTTGLADEHYAPMPQALAERCIRAGSAAGDLVLDPFAGSGTTGLVAERLQRHAILIDLGYQEMQARRTDGVQVELFV